MQKGQILDYILMVKPRGFANYMRGIREREKNDVSVFGPSTLKGGAAIYFSHLWLLDNFQLLFVPERI